MNHRDHPILKRVAAHDEFILQNMSFFDRFFSKENWNGMTFGRIRDKPHSMYATKKMFKADMRIVGEILKVQFEYGCKTNALDICIHFKRRYNILRDSGR